jgi:UDP-N-acetyl-D-mannosaminuronic acid dehydrogenase
VDKKNVNLRLIPAARAINDSMPEHMHDLVKQALADSGSSINGSRILVLGYTYLENSDDTRNSPSSLLVSLLKAAGANVVIHDPFVQEFQGDIYDLSADCDAMVLMVKHDYYQNIDLERLNGHSRLKVLVDGRDLFTEAEVSEFGFVLRSLGRRH